MIKFGLCPFPIMKYAVVVLFAICAACNEASPKLPPGTEHSSADLGSHQQLREQALAFFHPLPDKVEHPACVDTPEKVALGKKLFLDPQLSSDGTISCNSCHQLDHFGVDNEVTSTGVGGQKGGTQLTHGIQRRSAQHAVLGRARHGCGTTSRYAHDEPSGDGYSLGGILG